MDENIPPSEIDKLSDVEVGEILRRTRTHYGQSLKDVEAVLRIRASQIDAIEKGEIHKLPGRVYAIGFVRSYAEYLGLDGAKVVQLFKTQYMDRQPREVLSFPVAASETKTPPSWLVLVCAALIVILLSVWGIWQSQGHVNVSEIEPLPKAIKERITEKVMAPPVAETVVPASANLEDMGAKESKKTGIILNIKDNSWVEIKDGKGAVIVSDVLEKGDQYFVPDSPGITMSLGNAGGVELVLNGKVLMPLGKEGDVLRDIPLETSHLKTLEFKSEEVPKPEETTKNDNKSVKKPPAEEN